MKHQLTTVAESLFRTILRVSAEENGIFRALLTVNLDGTPKPLLVVGSVHPRIEDGECIAVLNPTRDLSEELRGGVAYGGGIREIVQGRCDAMVNLWIDAYGRSATSVLYSYASRAPSLARFEVC